MQRRTIEEMRADLETVTKTSMDIPDSHIEAAWMAYDKACEKDRPGWSRREMMLIFEYIADGNGDVMLKIEELRAQLNRNPDFDGDMVGRWDDSDYEDAAAS